MEIENSQDKTFENIETKGSFNLPDTHIGYSTKTEIESEITIHQVMLLREGIESTAL